ncbi:High-affinity nitrate transporter 3.1 [Linum perenne]
MPIRHRDRPYTTKSSANQSIDWLVEKDVPTATYFVRAYAVDAEGKEVAYRQSTNAKKTTNLLQVEAVSGRHATLDIVSVCFSVFSIVSLFGLFYNEKRKGKSAKPYTTKSSANQSIDWLVEKDVPTATYFVRAYAVDAEGKEVAYGQSTNAKKTTNLLQVEAVSGRHATLDIVSVCFSVFSIVSLFGLFYNEKR